MRDMVQDSGQEQRGGFQRLFGTAIAQFSVGQQIRSNGEIVIVLIRYRQRARRFDDQQIAGTCRWLGDQGLLRVAVLERTKGCVDLCLLRPKEMSAALGGVSASERPGLRLFGHDCPQTLVEVLLSVSADLKASLCQFRTKSFDVGLHPERHECLPVTDSSTVLAVEKKAATSQIGHTAADGTQGHIRLFGKNAIWPVDECGMNKDGHDGLDPALLRPTQCGARLLGWLAPFDVNEQAGGLQMSVASEIDVVDVGTLQNQSLLGADVWRKKEEPIANVAGGQTRHPAVQLVDDDADILVTEMTLFLDEVANGPLRRLPGNDSVKTVEGLRDRADRGRWHPLPEEWSVPV